ncbi:MAG TPA: rod shape-determining protein MreC [Firmicutes bacterium]|nr:rod shape-determining protein MreC [Bacillota bacterium]
MKRVGVWAALAVLAAVAVVVIGGLTAGERQRVTVVELALREALRPGLEVLARAGDAVTGTVRTVLSLPELWRQREEWQSRQAEAMEMQRRLQLLEEENRRLRALLGFRPSLPLPTVGAQVIGRNGDSWFSRILIDQGSGAGVGKDAAVLTERGLVGRVSSLSLSGATVTLISDPGSAVGAKVVRSGDAGICYGQVGTPLLRMRFFSREAEVMPGDTVVTSGLGGVFPPDFMLGVVVETYQGDYGLVQYAVVRPAVDLERLEKVLVVKSP